MQRILYSFLIVVPLIFSPPLVAQTIEYRIDQLSSSLLRHVNYILTSLLPYEGQHFRIDALLTIDCIGFSPSLCSALADAGDDEGHLDFQKLRTIWFDNYLVTRGNRGNDDILLDDLQGFKEITGYPEWPNRVIDSRVKSVRRRLSRGVINNRQVSVAESLTSEGAVRETEVAIERINEPNNFEFYTYDHAGVMVLASEFPAGPRPSPIICVACHMNRDGQANRFITAID